MNKNDLVEHLPDLRRYARSLLYRPADAEALVQETLQAALDNLPVWLRPPKRRAWLFGITHNRLVNQVRTGRIRERHFPTLVSLHGHAVEPPADVDDNDQQLRRALQSLPVEDRSLLLLVAQAGFSYEDTAEILGVTVDTLMSRLYRARCKLRNLLEERDDHRFRGQR